jgi:hypothetical protein
MKVLSYILRLANWLAAVGVGIIGFAWAANFIDLGIISNFITQINTNPTRIIALLLTAYLVLFNLLYFFGSLFVRRYATHIKLSMPNGDFSIALAAIEDSLRRQVKKLPEVYDVHIRIKKDKKSETKPMTIKAYYSTREGTNVQDVTAKIQEVIRMRFQEIVEVKEPPVFKIYLTDIVDRDSKKSESKRKEKPELAEYKTYYSGPQYPVDDNQ